MTPETMGALLFRFLGVVLLLLGTFVALGTVISPFSTARDVAYHDIYFVASESMLWSIALAAAGIFFLLFSRALGRILAKGLR